MNFILNAVTLGLVIWLIWRQKELRDALKTDIKSVMEAVSGDKGFK